MNTLKTVNFTPVSSSAVVNIMFYSFIFVHMSSAWFQSCVSCGSGWKDRYLFMLSSISYTTFTLRGLKCSFLGTFQSREQVQWNFRAGLPMKWAADENGSGGCCSPTGSPACPLAISHSSSAIYSPAKPCPHLCRIYPAPKALLPT